MRQPGYKGCLVWIPAQRPRRLFTSRLTPRLLWGASQDLSEAAFRVFNVHRASVTTHLYVAD